MKIKDQIINEYFEWMYNMMCGDMFDSNTSYRKLFAHLHSTEFTYSIERDSNRASDGCSLRWRFSLDQRLHNADEYLDDPCSVLEMIIALAIKCENLMEDIDYGDRTKQWFWSMITSIGLGGMSDSSFDKRYTTDCVTRLLNRDYEPNGKGGLFIIQDCEQDLREVEIWYQMNWYLDTFV